MLRRFFIMLKRCLFVVLILFFVSYHSFSQEVADTTADTGNVAGTASADAEADVGSVLIDFSVLSAGGPEVEALTHDFSSQFYLSVSAEEVSQLKKPYTIDNWRIVPASSLEYPIVFAKSQIKPVLVTKGQYEGQSVLGIRAFFPNFNYEMSYEIQPPFRPYNTEDNTLFNGFGSIDNVGEVYQARMTVYGLNNQERLFLITEDSYGNTYEYSFGGLNFVGWKTVTWTNPQYVNLINEVDTQLPLYPQNSAYRLIKAIKIVHPSYLVNEDMVTYIRDVTILHDKASIDLNDSINHEDVWEIIRESSFERQQASIRANDVELYFRFLQERKKYNYKPAGDTGSTDTGS